MTLKCLEFDDIDNNIYPPDILLRVEAIKKGGNLDRTVLCFTMVDYDENNEGCTMKNRGVIAVDYEEFKSLLLLVGE